MSIATSSGSGVSKNLNIVKQYFKKPMTAVVGVLAILSLVIKFLMNSQIGKSAEALLSTLGTSSAETTTSSNPLSYILSAVVALCIMMIFVSSLSQNGGPTIWFTILHALSVLQLLFTAIAALFVMITEVVVVFNPKMIIQFLADAGLEPFASYTDIEFESLYRRIDSYKVSMIVVLVITLVIFAIYLYYINSQTAFLKGVTLTCKNPQLKSQGAVPYGNLSMVIGVVMLVVVGISALFTMGSKFGLETSTSLDLSAFGSATTLFLVQGIIGALYAILRGYFAKGWAAFAKENEAYVYESVGASTRTSEASPMPTYKSTTRSSQDARQQSQPYLIGEEEDPNKKSSYIPEELQQDYNDQQPQMYGAGGGDMYGNPYGGQPQAPQFGGDPYGNPYGGQPQPPQYGGDPYGNPDPFAQSPMGGNPYGGNPYGGNNGGGYNNGMM